MKSVLSAGCVAALVFLLNAQEVAAQGARNAEWCAMRPGRCAAPSATRPKAMKKRRAEPVTRSSRNFGKFPRRSPKSTQTKSGTWHCMRLGNSSGSYGTFEMTKHPEIFDVRSCKRVGN